MNTNNKLRSFPNTFIAPLTQVPLVIQYPGKQTEQTVAVPDQQLATPETQVSGEAVVGVATDELTKVYPVEH